MSLQALTIPEQQPVFNGGYFDYTFATAVHDLFAIPDNSHLVALYLYVQEAFNGSSPSPAAKIGDADDDDGFFTNAEAALGTTGLKIWRPLADVADLAGGADVATTVTKVNELLAALRKPGILGTATGYNRTAGKLYTAGEKIARVDFTKGGTPTTGKAMVVGVYNTWYQLNLLGMKV